MEERIEMRFSRRGAEVEAVFFTRRAGRTRSIEEGRFSRIEEILW
jgi:hypothetical protein